MKVQRLTVDLASYPDLVVIYLGMKVRTITGLKTLIGFGPKISNSVAQMPDGLLRHENMLYSLFPPHAGMRQYWRDFESLEKWARSEPHRTACGGQTFSKIREELDSGTRHISCAESKQSTMTFKCR